MKKIFVDFARKFFAKFFFLQHPEAALRYLPVVSAIKKANLIDGKILEVGSGSLGITPYIKRQVDGLDIDFSGPQTSLLNQIRGNAERLHFRKNSYDVVISVDVIEHLPRAIRPKAIYEMLRVAHKLAVIVVPVGKLSQEQDRVLDDHWRKIFKNRNQFLFEHLKNGLPTTDQILVDIDKSLRILDKRSRVTSFPSLNLAVRNILMRTWISKSRIVYYLYMKGYLLFIPILKFANFGNCYRRVFIVELVR